MTNHTNRNSPRSRPHAARAMRRAKPKAAGVAMLLVLVCLATATIATTAYITSRDNSAVIGENVASAAAANWAAGSGLDSAIALLETNWDWRTLHVNGTLFTDVLIAGAAVTVHAEDLLTNQPPTESSRYVSVAAFARVGSSEQTAGAILDVPGPLDEAVVVDLSEFAAFVSGSLELRDRAVLARWPRSPLAPLRMRTAIGGTATLSSSIVVGESAAAIDVTAFTQPSASSTLLSRLSGPEIQVVELPDAIPFPAPPPLAGVEDVTVPTPPNYTLPAGSFLISENSRFNKMDLRNSAALTLRGDITVVLEDNLEITTGAKLFVDGDVTLIVFGNLLMDNGAIELREDARLTTFVRGGALASWATELRDSYVGNARTDSVRDATGEADWMNPQRIRFYSVENLLNVAGWRLRGNSVVKGELYAPHAGELRIEGNSAVYGRVASSDVRMREDSAIFYCHVLKPLHGFTNLVGALYDENGRLKDDFKTFTSLDPLALETVASGTRSVIRLGNNLIGDEADLASDTGANSVSVGTVSLGGTVARIEGRFRR